MTDTAGQITKPAAQGAAPVVMRPAINDDNAYFWDGVDTGELRIQRCMACGVLRHPSSPGCAACGSVEWDWIAASGRGRIHSHAVVHHPLLPPFIEPYAVAVLELEEGVRFVSQLTGFDLTDLRVDAEVRLRFVEVAEGLILPLFEPAGS